MAAVTSTTHTHTHTHTHTLASPPPHTQPHTDAKQARKDDTCVRACVPSRETRVCVRVGVRARACVCVSPEEEEHVSFQGRVAQQRRV